MQAQQNPQLAQALKMAQSGNPKEVVKNLIKEQGVSKGEVDELLGQFGLSL